MLPCSASKLLSLLLPALAHHPQKLPLHQHNLQPDGMGHAVKNKSKSLDLTISNEIWEKSSAELPYHTFSQLLDTSHF
jgi:hypothetical protein